MKTFSDDIELIELEERVQSSLTMTPACLAPSTPPRDGTTCYATGWGYTGKFFCILIKSTLREYVTKRQSFLFLE